MPRFRFSQRKMLLYCERNPVYETGATFFPPGIFCFVVFSCLKNKTQRRRKKEVYAHRQHLPCIKILISLRWQIASIALINGN